MIDVLISYMLCKLYPIKDVFFAACKGTAYAAAASIPLSIVLVGFSGGRLGGENTNSMVGPISNAGVLGTMCIMYLVLNKAISRHLAFVFFIIYMSSLILTFNKTGIISFILASMVYVILAPGNFRRHVRRILIMAVGLTVVIFAASSRITAYVSKTGAGSVETLSGRTALWIDTYKQIVRGPYIRGFGETAFREIGPNLANAVTHSVHPHNEFLAVWFNFGLVGVVLVYSSYFALTIVSWKAFRRGLGYLPVLVLCAVVYYFIAGIAAASFSMCLFPIQWLLLYDCLISTHFGAQRCPAFKD
jgi:O-antigen ligase